MNPYKAAWYVQQQVGLQELPPAKQAKRRAVRTQGKAQYQGVSRGMSRRMGQTAAIGVLHSIANHAAQSQISGRLGMTLRVGGRVGLRFVPVVGMALVAYDLYQLGKWITED